MNEQSRPSREQQAGPGGFGSIFDEPDELPGQVRVSSGPFDENLPVANTTVGEIRRRFGPRMDIADNAQAVLDGRNVSNDTIVRQNQVLMFTHPAGEKGNASAKSPFIYPKPAPGPSHLTVHSPRWRPLGTKRLRMKLGGERLAQGRTRMVSPFAFPR